MKSPPNFGVILLFKKESNHTIFHDFIKFFKGSVNILQHCHDPGLTRLDPDPPLSDLTLIDRVMMGQGSVGNFHVRDYCHIEYHPTSCKELQDAASDTKC